MMEGVRRVIGGSGLIGRRAGRGCMSVGRLTAMNFDILISLHLGQ